MQPRLVVAALILAASSAAAHAAASPESVDRLLQVMQVQSQLEMIYSQVLPGVQNAMRQSLGPRADAAEAEHLANVVMPRVQAVLREELGWTKLKPGFATIYAETFTQQEVDGLIAFYEGPIGRALVAKTPQLTQRSFQMMQQRMGPVMQKVMQIVREEIDKERAKSAPKR
jgi:uncharacterized protein